MKTITLTILALSIFTLTSWGDTQTGVYPQCGDVGVICK